jgi:hypothetical protein
MRDPMYKSQRLTDGTGWWTFMRVAPVGRSDDILHQNARPGAGLLVLAALRTGEVFGAIQPTMPAAPKSR